MFLSRSISCSRTAALAAPILIVAVLSLAVECSAWTETAYTSQRKPRITVLEFADTNTDANLERFGPSVSAMLVTYLKRNSQFIVVERQDIKEILNEWERNQTGMTNLDLSRTQAELLEKIDVFITGKVTVLTEAKQADSPTHIEIDAKLLSRTDGRIITAVRRGGLRQCLRSTVTRLGSAIQQDYLRPYFGKLRINLQSPEYTRFYLTPVLRNDALAEERPPVELSRTTYPGEDQDVVSPWVTNPTSYTIDNLLSGWYTVRLERPGYGSIEAENSRFQAVEVGDSIRIRYRDDAGRWIPLEKADPRAPWRSFLVEVQPLTLGTLNGTSVGFHLPKQKGSIRLSILDERSRPLPEARVYLRSLDLALNPESPDIYVWEPPPEPEEQAGEPIEGVEGKSTLESRPPKHSPNDVQTQESLQGSSSDSQPEPNPVKGKNTDQEADRVHVTLNLAPPPPTPKKSQENVCKHLIEEHTSGSSTSEGRVLRGDRSFNVSTFGGGHIAFENYRGEPLPKGTYEVVVWAPYYTPVRRVVHVSDGDGFEALPVQMEREHQEIVIRGRSNSQVTFEGELTSLDLSVTPDRLSGIERLELPVDQYRVHAELERFGSWNRSINLLSRTVSPPTLEDVFRSAKPSPHASPARREPIEIPLKDEIWIGGRTEGFLEVPDAYYDKRVERALDLMLGASQATRQVALLKKGENELESFETLLEDLDLLVLNEADVARLRLLDDVAQAIRGFIDRGRAVLAFVTYEGDYEGLFGAPLSIRKRMTTARKLTLRPGEVRTFDLKETIDLGARRALPRLERETRSSAGWRVLAKSEKGNRPRLLERGDLDQGGYVMVWLESSQTRALHGAREAYGSTLMKHFGRMGQNAAQRKLTSLLGSQASELGVDHHLGKGGIAEGLAADAVGRLFAAYEQRKLTKQKARRLALGWSKEQEANDKLFLLRAKIQNRALDWAEHLMFRRLGGQPEKVQAAREKIALAE